MACKASSHTSDCSDDCKTTAGSCLWSPIKINLPMASAPAGLRVQSNPSSCGSKIWVASSTIATSKVFNRKSSVLEESVATVPTKTRQRAMRSCTCRRVAQDSNTFSIRYGRNESSQDNSLPKRIKSISGSMEASALLISSTARLVYESSRICFPSPVKGFYHAPQRARGLAGTRRTD